MHSIIMFHLSIALVTEIVNNIENYVKSLSGYREIDKLSGEFKFNQCEQCKGPKFAH